MPKLFSVPLIKSFLSFFVMPLIMIFMVSVNMFASANDEAVEVTIKFALDVAQAHAPGKVVAQEKVDELVSEEGLVDGSETLQPVYRIKILSPQGVMKTVLVHRKTGLVIE
ncbi:MAG: hypothetical protein ACI978_002566 [Oleispira sp.]|jgi:hypothetical protein